MSRYEQLLAENEHIKIKDTHSLPDGYSGFYKDGIILIDKDLSETRKAEVLYEELAHHKLTYGNILDQSKDINRNLKTTLSVTDMKSLYLCALLWRRITMVLITYMN